MYSYVSEVEDFVHAQVLLTEKNIINNHVYLTNFENSRLTELKLFRCSFVLIRSSLFLTNYNCQYGTKS